MGHNFKELKIWILAKQIAIDIYILTKKFPDDEKFGLVNQMRRCSISVVSNIAEGSGRNNNGEFYQFLGIATGSLHELETQLIISFEVQILNEENFKKIISKIEELKKMLYVFKSKFTLSKT